MPTNRKHTSQLRLDGDRLGGIIQGDDIINACENCGKNVKVSKCDHCNKMLCLDCIISDHNDEAWFDE